MTYRRVAALAALALALAACKIDPDGPTLRIADASTTEVWLAWLPPARGDFTGFAVERRAAGGSFLQVAVVGTITSYRAKLAGPEASNVAFRVRALPDPDGTRASNVVSHRVGLLPVGVGADLYDGPEDGVLTLFLTSTRFPVVLERRAGACTGAATAWTQLPLAAGATRYVDSDLSAWTDGSVLEYRATAVAGTDRSEPTVYRTAAAPPLRPAALVATSSGAGTRVAFENASRCPVVVTVRAQFDQTVVGTVPIAAGPGTPGELLVEGPRAGAQAFTAEAQPAGAASRILYPVRAWTLGVDPAPGWKASLVDLPPGYPVARLPSGALVTQDGNVLHAPGPAGRDALETTNLLGVRADTGGHVHALFVRPLAAPGAQLVHAEHDGSAWGEEVVTSFDAASFAGFELGVDGTVLAAWRSGWNLFVAARRSGTWQIDTLTDFYRSGLVWGPIFLAGDDAGVPHVVALVTSQVHDWSRGVAGWQDEVLPDSAAWLRGACATPGALTVAYEPSVYATDFPLDVVDRTAAGWGVPVRASGIPAGPWVQALCSPYGARVAIVAPGTTWLRDAAGAAARSWPRVQDYLDGFGPDGKLWILHNLSLYATGSGVPDPGILLEEP